MSRYKLYYWLSNYNSILPSSMPDEDWSTAISSLIDDFLKMNYGNREMIFDSIEYLDFASDSDILAWCKEKLRLLFSARNESYKRIFEGLTEHYNPLWNVDGSVIEKHAGTDTHKNSGTDTITNSGTDARTIETVDDTDTTHGGTTTEELENSGTDTTSEIHSGTDTTDETHGGTDNTNNNVAAFDQVIPVLANSSQTTNGHTINTELEHGESVSGSVTHGLNTDRTVRHGETISEEGTHETTDNLVHGHVVTTQNGKQISDEYGHTVTTTRTGNIGVTKSTELLKDHLELWNGLSFLDMIAKDIVNTICYSVI